MKYKMFEEIKEQPKALKDTLKEEKNHMKEVSEKIQEFEKIYLVGCGSSLSTCYSTKSAHDFVSDQNLEVFTGYEFFYHKKLERENACAILTSQSGETADTVAAMKYAKQNDLFTVAITNESECRMIKLSDDSIITRGGTEKAILGTKTLWLNSCVYHILFEINGSEDEKTKNVKKTVLKDILKLPNKTKELIDKTEVEGRNIAREYMDDDMFYCMGSGPNYGLAYKLAMTMFMEGSLKHSCPLYSGEFRHGLIERAEKDVCVVFLDANYLGDDITNKSIEFGEKIGVKPIIYKMNDYSDMNRLMSPFALIIPIEWFIYYLAHFNGEDPGSTRHIGKVRY